MDNCLKFTKLILKCKIEWSDKFLKKFIFNWESCQILYVSWDSSIFPVAGNYPLDNFKGKSHEELELPVLSRWNNHWAKNCHRLTNLYFYVSQFPKQQLFPYILHTRHFKFDISFSHAERIGKEKSISFSQKKKSHSFLAHFSFSQSPIRDLGGLFCSVFLCLLCDPGESNLWVETSGSIFHRRWLKGEGRLMLSSQEYNKRKKTSW